MKKDNTKKMGEVLGEYVKEMQLKKKLNEVRLKESWEDIVGKTIARSTQKIFIKQNVLFVYLSSSVIRHELMMIKTPLLERINEISFEEILDLKLL